MSLMKQFYIGKAYSFRSFNCWHYVSKVRADQGIETKAFSTKNFKEAFSTITKQMRGVDHGLTKVDKPQNFDIVIINKTELGRLSYHCGVFHNGYIAHCDRVSGQVLYQTYKQFTQGYEGAVIWR